MDRIANQAGYIADAKPGHHLIAMRLDCFQTDIQETGNFLFRAPHSLLRRVIAHVTQLLDAELLRVNECAVFDTKPNENNRSH